MLFRSNYGNIAVQVQDGDTTWEDITIEDNETTAYVFEAEGSTGTLFMDHCVAHDNSSTYQSFYTYGLNVEIYNCLFYDNDTTSYLLYMYGSNNQVLYNSVFYNNTTAYYNLVNIAGARVSSSIFYGNTSTRATFYVGTGTLSYTDFYANTTGSGFGATDGGGTGIGSSNPQFTDPESLDFTLNPYSPCVDAGDPSSVYNDADGSRNDMGLYGGPHG